MWIDDIATDEHLRTWVKHCPAMKLVSTLEGEILWANAAFCEWSKYTLNELRRLTWMQISVPDASLVADIQEMKNLDAYNPTYSVTKQYIAKNEKPQWGQLSVMRYPLTGDIECCLCTWEPLKNGTATAFGAAMDQSLKVEQRLIEMAAEIRLVTSQTEEDKFALNLIRMTQRHPRIVMAIIFVMLSVLGVNNVMEILQRTGVVELPVTVKAESRD
jgi:hypothetical protein